MLPYHWPHPSWTAPDPRYNHTYTSASSHSMKYPERNCCARHAEVFSHLQRRLDATESQLKSVMNHLAKQGLESAIPLPKGASTPLVETPQTPETCSSSSAILRKRKSLSDKDSNKCSTIVKRKKLIHDLELQVAAERADNQKMEERIAEMRKQLAALRSRRHQITVERLEKVVEEEGSDVGELDSEADSDDEYDSDMEDDGKEQNRATGEVQQEAGNKS